MNFVYATPGIAALIEWLLAAILYTLGWYRMKRDLNRLGDSLALAGLITASGGVAWVIWDTALNRDLVRSSLATGLVVSALVVYAILAHRRTERLSAAAMSGFAILLQAYAVGQLLWGETSVVLPQVFLPPWTALYVLTGLVGCGALVVSAMMILLLFTSSRAADRLPGTRLTAVLGLPALEWRAWQVALVALSVSLSIGLIRSWWGWGQAMANGLPWMLITWLSLAAGAYGLIQGATRRRPARTLLVLACAFGIIAVLTMAWPLVGAGPQPGAG